MSKDGPLVVDTNFVTESGASQKVKVPKDKDLKCRHWSYLFENLRRTVDAIYDTCQADRNIYECKEAVIILRNYYHDFEKLIQRLQVEEAWEKSDRPTAVAWEIRKTMGSPTKVLSVPPMPSPRFSPIILPMPPTAGTEPDRAQTPKSCTQQPDDPCDSSNRGTVINSQKRVLEPVNSESEPLDPTNNELDKAAAAEDDGWSVVRYGKAKKVDSKTPVLLRKAYGNGDDYIDEPMSNYMNPRSAMDIPQTKASLAKMAHCRKKIWNINKPHLEEIMQAKKRAEYRNVLRKQKGASLPAINRIGINFKDPNAVSLTAQKFNAQQLEAKSRAKNIRNCEGKSRKHKYRHMQSTESVYSLESISEVDENMRPKSQNEQMSNTSVSTPVHPESGNGTPQLPGSPVENGVALRFFWERPLDTASLPASRPFCGWSGVDEEEYKQLTEEEESLALEEESLQKEYREEQMKSIDAEIERQLQDSCASEIMVEAEDVVEEIVFEEAVQEEEQKDDSVVQTEQVAEEAEPSTTYMPWADLMKQWTAEQNLMSKVSWADLVNMELSMVELSDIRTPGDAAKMHEKLSSPSRKRLANDEEAMRRHEERLAKAECLRLKLQERKMDRMRELSRKVNEVRSKKQTVIEKKKLLLDKKMEKAAENRENKLQAIVKKAKNEEEKVHEIAFYNYLEADNRRNDVLSRHQEETQHVKQRLASLEEERLRKVNEKAAKEAAAEERRKLAAEERTMRLRDQAEKKRVRSMQVQMQKCEQEKEKVLAAREKSKERKDRLADIKAAQLANSQELKTRISHKQEETSRRYEENLVQIKLRASEMSTPRLPVGSAQCDTAPNSRPMLKPQYCTLCSTMLESELIVLAHVISAEHKEQLKESDSTSDTVVDARDSEVAKNVKTIEDIRKANEKSQKVNFRKKKQKLKQKITGKIKEYNPEIIASKIESQKNQNGKKNRIHKLCDEMNHLINSNPMENMWMDKEAFSFDRNVGDIIRTLSNNTEENADQMVIWKEGTGDLIVSLLNTVHTNCVPVPLRSLANAATVLIKSVLNNRYVCVELFYSNRMTVLIDILTTIVKTKIETNEEGTLYVPIACILSSCIANVVTTLNSLAVDQSFWNDLPDKFEGFLIRTSLYSNYIVLLGFVEMTKEVVDNIVQPVQSLNKAVDELLNPFLYTLVVFTDSASLRTLKYGGCSGDGCGAVVSTLRETRLCGLLSLIYDWVVQPAWQTLHSTATPTIDDKQTSLTLATFVLFNRLATADRTIAQSMVSGDWQSLHFRFICYFLLRVCDKGRQHVSLLQQVIIAIGHFVSLNNDNQDVVNIMPTYILNELCSLPSQYLSDYKLKKVVFPTLVACCYRNTSNRRHIHKYIPSSKFVEFIQEEIENHRKEMENSQLKLNIFEFSIRFPEKIWKDAELYFLSELEENG